MTTLAILAIGLIGDPNGIMPPIAFRQCSSRRPVPSSSILIGSSNSLELPRKYSRCATQVAWDVGEPTGVDSGDDGPGAGLVGEHAKVRVGETGQARPFVVNGGSQRSRSP